MTQLNTFLPALTTDTTVYSKTNAGRLLAFDQNSHVNMELRNLLRRVDGRATYDQLISTSSDAVLFTELLARQLVQISPAPWRNSAGTVAHQDTSSNARAGVNPTANPQPDKHTAPEHRLSLVTKQNDTKQYSKLEIIKLQMTSFIQAHLPTHALTTLPEIAALTSEVQLLCMFNGYVNLIDSTGKAGQVHVQELLLTLAGDM